MNDYAFAIFAASLAVIGILIALRVWLEDWYYRKQARNRAARVLAAMRRR